MTLTQWEKNGWVRLHQTSLHWAQHRRPDRANPMDAGAASASQPQIDLTRCHNGESGFALFRHWRRT